MNCKSNKISAEAYFKGLPQHFLDEHIFLWVDTVFLTLLSLHNKGSHAIIRTVCVCGHVTHLIFFEPMGKGL